MCHAPKPKQDSAWSLCVVPGTGLVAALSTTILKLPTACVPGLVQVITRHGFHVIAALCETVLFVYAGLDMW